MAVPTGVSQPAVQLDKLQRIRRISRPLAFLFTAVLVIGFAIVVLQAGVLVLFDHIGAPAAYAGFSSGGPVLEIGPMTSPPATLVPVANLTQHQRLIHAGLTLLCGACGAWMLLQLRGLFALYGRGVIFAAENAQRMKGFGLWLAVTAIVINLSGRIFAAVIHVPLEGTANAALSVIYGAMIYVIAYVLDLGREADLERKEFI